jgi:hypothetical protein
LLCSRFCGQGSVERENRLYKLEISVGSVQGNANAVVFTSMTSNLDDLMLWHHHLGYLNLSTIQAMHKEEMVEGLPKILKQPSDLFCERYMLAKQHCNSFPPAKSYKEYARKSREFFHADVCGPISVP